jgi:hypothetical protein
MVRSSHHSCRVTTVLILIKSIVVLLDALVRSPFPNSDSPTAAQLPYDSIRDEFCVGCARRNIETPSLLNDPDHAHSCTMQQGVSVRRRHDAIKQVLAELARSCGYHVEVEPQFPATIDTHTDPLTGQAVQFAHKPRAHGDLLLVRGNVCQLIDVTVVRPTTLTLLRGSSTHGAHLQPLVAAVRAEETKHHTYDVECARHGWKLVPFALESFGAQGKEATQLLQSMAAHSLDLSPEAFLIHAGRRLSMALQSGNAGISIQGTTELLLHSHPLGGSGGDEVQVSGFNRGPGRNQLRRAVAKMRTDAGATESSEQFSSILHADYRSVRIGVRRTGAGA